MDELLLCVAPVPGDNQEERFPGQMDVVAEVIRCHSAGASMVHLHVRDEQGRQSTDPSLFRKQVEQVRADCPIIIEGSTGGTPEHTLEERCVAIAVPGIEMGSLNMGSINMAGGVYQNPMRDIRFYASEMVKRHIKPSLCIFDLSMLFNVTRLEEEGLLGGPLVYNLIFDVPDTIPFSHRVLDIFLSQLPEGALWFLTRHHAPGSGGFQEALERGGHVRVGYEDGPFLSTGKRARSNSELIEDIAQVAREMGRKVVDPARAREILGIGQGNRA
jgi:3-keto-5-aminohexanoate cleavage enzyme